MGDIRKEYTDIIAIIERVIDGNTKAIVDLSSTLIDVRISLKGVQTEVEGHNRLMEEMSESIRELKIVGDGLKNLQSQVNSHVSEGTEARRRINERLDDLGKRNVDIEKENEIIKRKIVSIDSKSKIDIVKLLVSSVTWILGGSGAFAILAWIYETFILNRP